MLKVIPIADRHKYRCHECGETRSVKYFIESYNPTINDKNVNIAYCNKCALKVSARNTINDIDQK